MLIDFYIRPVKPSVTPRKVTLLPLTEEDELPPPRKKREVSVRGPYKRATKEELKKRRSERLKKWLLDPEVLEHQRKMARLRAERYYKRKQEGKCPTGTQGSSRTRPSVKSAVI